MSNTVVVTKDDYTKESLEQLGLTRSSSELQRNRYFLGTNIHATSTDTDAFEITESTSHKIKKKAVESFAVTDGDEKSYGVTLFDLELDRSDVNAEDWRDYVNSKAPLNYSEVRPLIPGEYEYKDAIVGVQMSIPPVEGRFGIIGSTLHVDVPDTVEKGTVQVTSSGPSTVTLGKRFYKETKVLTSLVDSDQQAAVEISEIGLTSFKIGLKSLTNPGLYVNGTIDWLVEGY